MPNKVLTVDQCPYRKTRFVYKVPFEPIEERHDFQFAENGKIEIVSIGEFDLVKEVNSHKDEVGLINVLKLAESRGISLDTFAKTEPGVMADVEDIDTFDDLLKAQADANAKLEAIASGLGLTVDQLIAAVKTGKDLKPVEKVAIESEVKE